jgi:SAM-dependent methyltransferase
VNGPFDLILDIGCFHSLPARSRERYAASMPHLLAPGGTFLLYAWMDEAGKYGTGLGKEDLALLASGVNNLEMPQTYNYLRLVERQDGTERGARPSAWLTYQCVIEDPENSQRSMA